MARFFKVVDTPTAGEILAAFNMQDVLNSRISPDWKEARWPWGVAITDEVMEIRNTIGWKWWKDTAANIGLTTENIKQLRLELVDIWHFALSCGVEEAHYTGQSLADVAEAAAKMFADCQKELEDTLAQTPDDDWQISVDYYLSRLTHAANDWSDGVAGYVDIPSFYALCCAFGLESRTLMATYTGKYALNKFRWDNGYAEGTYTKHWLIPQVSAMYQEDNWYLDLILEDFAEHNIEFNIHKIYEALASYYKRMQEPGRLH